MIIMFALRLSTGQSVCCCVLLSLKTDLQAHDKEYSSNYLKCFFQKSGSVFNINSVFSKIWQRFLNEGRIFLYFGSVFGSVFFKNLVVFFRIFSGSVYPLSILNLSGALAYGHHLSKNIIVRISRPI